MLKALSNVSPRHLLDTRPESRGGHAERDMDAPEQLLQIRIPLDGPAEHESRG